MNPGLLPTATPDAPTAGPETTATPSAAAEGRVRLHAVGDIMLARRLVPLMDEHGAGYPFEAVGDLLRAADLTIGNLEGTLTERGTAANKVYTFRTPPRHVAGLVEAGIDIVSLGNNHAMDFGREGLEDTLAALSEAGIAHSGAGLDEAAARRPAVIEVNGLVLAFLSYNGAAIWEAFPAGPETPGVALADVAAIREDVAGAAIEADVVIVSLHAGNEYVDAPSEAQVLLSRAAIEAGAALVLGHHAHVFQGWTRYGEGIIVYGLGNFVFDLDHEDLAVLGAPAFQTAVLEIELTREGAGNVVAHPVFIDPAENRPVPAEGEQRREIEERITRLNAALP